MPISGQSAGRCAAGQPNSDLNRDSDPRYS
jgi:hypothetical protein